MDQITVSEREHPGLRLVLRHGVLADGSAADVAIDQHRGRICAIGTLAPMPGDTVQDCTGMVIVPSGVEVHAHLDKALSNSGSAMPVDLPAAVADWLGRAPSFDEQDYVRRATSAVESMVSHGTTTMRTHVDIATAVGLTAVRALVAVRDSMRARKLADIDIVGLVAPPFDGSPSDPHLRLLDQAVELGIDVVGGSPDLDPDPLTATRAAVSAAAAAGLPIDLHTDQSIDPSLFFLPEYVKLIERSDIQRAAASHCISLASQPLDVQRRTAENIARIGMSVFTMPLTSPFFFGWDTPSGAPRGITAIHSLLAAGVQVAAGADNVRDAFFPLGRFDQIEVAAAIAMLAHLSPEQAWAMCSAAPRAALGLPRVEVAVGCPAELLAIAGANLSDAVAGGSEHRLVIHQGRVVSRTTTRRQLLC